MSLNVLLLVVWAFRVARSAELFDSIPGKLKFVHSALAIGPSEGKGDGVFVTRNVTIAMGSVLILEDALIDISKLSEKSETTQLKAILALTRLIREVDVANNSTCKSRCMDSLYISPLHLSATVGAVGAMQKKVSQSQIDDAARFYTNGIGECLFTFAAKLNHGYPTNVAASKHGKRIIIFATKDLHFGDELQWDYFGILGPGGSRTYRAKAEKFGIDMSKCSVLRHPEVRATVDRLAGEFPKGSGGDAGRILDGIIESGLISKFHSNGFCLSLLYLSHQDPGQLAGKLKRKLSGDIRWGMYNMEAWQSYGKSSRGEVPPQGFMGKEYTLMLDECCSLDNVQ